MSEKVRQYSECQIQVESRTASRFLAKCPRKMELPFTEWGKLQEEQRKRGEFRERIRTSV